jgi:hypothetical protein
MGFSEKQFSGKYSGQYTYGPSYGERLKGKTVPFTLIMEVDGRGQIKGHIVDDGYADQFDAHAEIKGTVVQQHIQFVKTYPHHWETTRGDEIIEDKKRSSQEVHYAGEFRNGVFAGEWKIFSTGVCPDGSIAEWAHGGYWIMHKEA